MKCEAEIGCILSKDSPENNTCVYQLGNQLLYVNIQMHAPFKAAIRTMSNI